MLKFMMLPTWGAGTGREGMVEGFGEALMVSLAWPTHQCPLAVRPPPPGPPMSTTALRNAGAGQSLLL